MPTNSCLIRNEDLCALLHYELRITPSSTFDVRASLVDQMRISDRVLLVLLWQSVFSKKVPNSPRRLRPILARRFSAAQEAARKRSLTTSHSCPNPARVSLRVQVERHRAKNRSR